MKPLSLFILLFFLSLSLNSQTSQGYLFSDDIMSKFESDTNAHAYQHYAVDLSKINEYKNLLEVEEAFVLKYKNYNPKKVEVDGDFFKFHPTPAIQEIINHAQDHRIVMINEAHFSAQNRVFTTIVVEELAKLGFKHLFIEDLTSLETEKRMLDMNRRKYPLATDGNYVSEPRYGSLMRRAMQLGYILHSYEHFPDNTIKDPMERWSKREEGQARNILKILKDNPGAKIIVHVGYGHLGEEWFEEGHGMMGAWVKKESGIDPFTIEQTNWVETYSDKTKNPYRIIVDQKAPASSSVYINDDGKLFSQDPDNYDVNVYFPATKYRNGRPDWLFWRADMKAVSLPNIKMSPPYQAAAFRAIETDQHAIPVDLIEIKKHRDEKDLVLNKGKYRLKVWNKNQQEELHYLEVK